MIWDVAKKRALVIGGGQRDGGVTLGNGRATAVLLARQGAEVCVVDRELDRAQATAAQIVEESGNDGVKAHAFAADLADSADCRSIVPRAAELLGGLDIMVNNVGIYAGDTHGNALSEDAFDTIMGVNLKSTWLTCQAAIPHLRAAGGGVIVNISSVAALNIGPNFAYGLSKTGVNALTSRMACENARFNVRIHAVMPGPIATPMFDSQLPGTGMTREELIADRAGRVPLRRIGSAWDIAHAVLYLVSDQASFTTGVILPVDGGIHTVNSGGCGNPE